MDLNVLDPALFAPQMHHGLPVSSTAHQDLLLAESLNNLPRLPDQIGGITIASLHSHNPPYSAHTLSSLPQDRERTSSTISSPYNYDTTQQKNGFEMRVQYSQQLLNTSNQAIPLHHELPAATSHLLGYPTPPQSQTSQSTKTIKKSTDFPKFHCGEIGCNFYRTDGNNHNGRYAMAKHYKQSHPDLQFEPGRLVSNHVGQKGYRMSPRSKSSQDETLHISSSTKHAKSAPFQDVAIDPDLLAASVRGSTSHTYHQNIEAKVKFPQHRQSNQALLPCLLETPFTHVPDLHISGEELRNNIRVVRNACDFETFKVRKLLLSHCRITGQPAGQFLAMRNKFFHNWIQRARDYITRLSGPLDARFSELGSWNDLVMEVGMMFFFAIQRSYLPQTGIMPDGTTLSEGESRRRKLCCELQAIKLCLEFCQSMSHTCDRIYHLHRMRAQGEAMSWSSTDT